MSFPGEQLVIRLWETVERAGGSIVAPWRMRREGIARIEVRRAEALVLAQTERDISDIRTGKRTLAETELAITFGTAKPADSGPMDSHLRVGDVGVRVSEQLVLEKIRTEVNVAKALKRAEDTLVDDYASPSDRQVDPDWFFRWREAAGRVTNEDLQGLWGRLLAGELKNPSSYSLRLVQFLANITTAEAGEIAALAPYVLGGIVYRDDTSVNEASSPLSFGSLMRMQELGLVAGAEALGLTQNFKSTREDQFACALLAHSRCLLFAAPDPALTLELPAYLLTTLGKQVFGLGDFSPNEGYLELVARRIGEKYTPKAMTVTVADFTNVGEGRIKLSNRRVLFAVAAT